VSLVDGRLQKLSKRLRDYVPPDTFSRRIEELSSILSQVDLSKSSSVNSRNGNHLKCHGILLNEGHYHSYEHCREKKKSIP
jgi:hypothetical protein